MRKRYITRTNDFRVTDEEAYKQLYSGLVCENGNELQDRSRETKHGGIIHAFGAFDTLDYRVPGKDVDFSDFLTGIQKILAPGEKMEYMEVSYSRSLCASTYMAMVTPKGIRIETDSGVMAAMEQSLSRSAGTGPGMVPERRRKPLP